MTSAPLMSWRHHPTMNTQSQPILGFLPGIHLWRRGPPLRRGSPISCAQLAAVRRLIPSCRQMSLYRTPAKCRSQNNCLIASDFMLDCLPLGMVFVVGRFAAIVAFEIAATEPVLRWTWQTAIPQVAGLTLATSTPAKKKSPGAAG